LYPICADRFPEGLYRVGAKALRFADGVLMVGARGTLISDKEAGRDSLRFETGSGTLAWYDTLTLDVEPTLTDGMVQGTGLDNCLGVLTMLAAAAALRSIEPALVEQNRRCLFVFSDQEEGIPEAYFGHGAARLTHAIPPPTFGCILADAHTVGANSNIVFGQGASHGNISAWSRGSVVPPNYLALALDLAEGINQIRPQTVQLNTGYLSRSDDMALGRWTQILGMIGAPMSDAHTGYERAHLADGQSAIWWLAHFTLATLALEPGLARRYAFVES
jgi:putative aminopeptidase FrvX